MATKSAMSLGTAMDTTTVPPAHSRREELLNSLLENTKNPIHQQILKAYIRSGTVEGAELEFTTIIDAIINED